LHTLILSRIDRLKEQEKTTLRVASIVGRLFRAQWLTGYYPELGAMPQVKAALEALETLDITPLDSPEPELAYLFKHIVTHEVTYESLPFATRAKLHEQLALFLESSDAPLDAIAFHYGRTENQEKQREYLRKAGEAAQKKFANDAALEYYGKLLPLLNEPKEQAEILLKRGQVLQVLGKFGEAEGDYRLALDSAKDDAALKASAQFALGVVNGQRGGYEAALDWLAQAKEARIALKARIDLAQVLIHTGTVLWRKGEYAQARQALNEAMALAREAGDKSKMARALGILGGLAYSQGDFAVAREHLEESLALSREIAAKREVSSALTSLGLVAHAQGDYTAARALHEESLALGREMGNKHMISACLTNLGIVAQAQGDYAAARDLYEECLVLDREMGDRWGIAIDLGNLGLVAYAQGDYAAARAAFEESLGLCKEMDEKTQMAGALLGLGLVDLAENKPEARENILGSLRLRQETGEQVYQTSSLIGAAGLVLQEGNPQFAAQLLGAVESALRALGAVVEPEVRPFHTQTLVALREQLGEPAFQSAWEEGSQWSLEEAVKRALE
jgi:tetratricopeptide (TPR) repeat protein